MPLSDYRYQLPEDQIAQEPLSQREASRMLVVNRGLHAYKDELFSSFPAHLSRGDLLVINNTKVFPARLPGRSETGARVEIFLIGQLEETVWQALARPSRRLPVGKGVSFAEGLSGTIVESSGEGRVVIRFQHNGDLDELLSRAGETPLPPYIKRPQGALDRDRERYQTVYARASGAIAAPTAGLHFTAQVLDDIRARKVEIAEITLHVGYGTFEPVRHEDLSEHRVEPEHYEIGPEAAERLERARVDGRRIVAVGTTTTRALESAITTDGRFRAERGMAELTIRPGYNFRAIGALLTNFHLPESSLLIMVSTFGGHELIMDAYKHAVAAGYRFYSYGDCMFIE